MLVFLSDEILMLKLKVYVFVKEKKCTPYTDPTEIS